MTYPLENNPFFKTLLTEVHNVASDMAQFESTPLSDDDAKAITQRICEERNEDSLDFWMFLSDVEALTDEDDWSDANGCIESIIGKHMTEKAAVPSA